MRGSLRCQPGQIARLKEASSGVRDLDPAQNAAAAERWRDQLQWCPVMSLWHTHSDVSSVFANGKHGGQSVEDLTKGLVEGVVQPWELPPLVAVQHGGHLWVVFGNRRLKALKQFAERSGSPGDIQARVIVHDLSNDDRVRLFAKFVLAATIEFPSNSTVPFRVRAHSQWWTGQRWSAWEEGSWWWSGSWPRDGHSSWYSSGGSSWRAWDSAGGDGGWGSSDAAQNSASCWRHD